MVQVLLYLTITLTDLVDAADEEDPDCDVVVTADEDDAPEVAVVAAELSFFVGCRG